MNPEPKIRVRFGHQVFCRQSYGGISRYFAEVASCLARSGRCQVDVLAPMHINSHLSKMNLKSVHGFRVPYSHYAARAIRWSNSALGILAARTSSGVDVYHETYYEMFDSAPARALRVTTVHDMIHELFPSSFRGLDATRQAKLRSIQRADHIICVSENTRSDLVRLLGVDADRVSVVHHGNSMAAYADTPATASAHPAYLLFVGSRGGYKNFGALVAALGSRHLSQSGIRLVCFGGGDFRPSELAHIEANGLAGRVEQVDGDDLVLAGLYRSALALVYPSLYEGFGIPLVEAMSLSCPVVCGDRSSLPEVAGDAAEYFDPADIDSIALAIERVLSSVVRRDELVDLGLARARAFSWEKCANETLSAYVKAMGTRP